MTPVERCDLKSLIAFDATDRAFLTLVVPEGVGGLAGLEADLSLHRSALGDWPDELEHFEANVEAAQGWFEAHQHPGGTLMLLSCQALDVLEAVHLPTYLAPLCVLDSGPYVRPLAECQDELGAFSGGPQSVGAARERAAEASLWARIQTAEDQAAWGPQAVIRALRSGPMEAVLLARRLEAWGIRCRACGYEGPGDLGACPDCGETALFEVDLVNTVIERAIWRGVELEFVDAPEGLLSRGGVAAI